jgi:hypothetical protein
MLASEKYTFKSAEIFDTDQAYINEILDKLESRTFDNAQISPVDLCNLNLQF